MSPIAFNLLIDPALKSKLAEKAVAAGITSQDLVIQIILAQTEAGREKQTREGSEPQLLPLDIGPLLTGSEALQFDALALRNGVAPEALAASAVRRLLRRDRQKPQTFRLKTPQAAKRKLEEHAKALGCGAGELAAFLFSRRAGRPQATVAGG